MDTEFFAASADIEAYPYPANTHFMPHGLHAHAGSGLRLLPPTAVNPRAFERIIKETQTWASRFKRGLISRRDIFRKADFRFHRDTGKLSIDLVLNRDHAQGGTYLKFTGHVEVKGTSPKDQTFHFIPDSRPDLEPHLLNPIEFYNSQTTRKLLTLAVATGKIRNAETLFGKSCRDFNTCAVKPAGKNPLAEPSRAAQKASLHRLMLEL